MTTFRLIATAFIAFFVSRAYLRYKDKSLTNSGFVFWIILWCAIVVLIFNPSISSIIAGFIGIGRGVDAVFLLSIILIFYLVFRLYVKLDQMDRNVTNFVTKSSIELHKIKKETNEL